MQELLIERKVENFANGCVVTANLSRAEKKKRTEQIMNELSFLIENMTQEFKSQLTLCAESIVKKHL